MLGSSLVSSSRPFNYAIWLANRKWLLQFAAKTDDISEEDKKAWETCSEALSALKFSAEEVDKILGKAFGLIHSPYWGEDRKKEVPTVKLINEILEYLWSLNLSNDDLSKVLKKFPEVLGCSLENELTVNVKILEKDWSIKGKTLRNLLLRNPKSVGL